MASSLNPITTTRAREKRTISRSSWVRKSAVTMPSAVITSSSGPDSRATCRASGAVKLLSSQ